MAVPCVDGKIDAGILPAERQGRGTGGLSHAKALPYRVVAPRLPSRGGSGGTRSPGLGGRGDAPTPHPRTTATETARQGDGLRHHAALDERSESRAPAVPRMTRGRPTRAPRQRLDVSAGRGVGEGVGGLTFPGAGLGVEAGPEAGPADGSALLGLDSVPSRGLAAGSGFLRPMP